MRIMALDYGDARTGVAISDLNGILCGETLVLNEWDAERLAQRVSALARERGCGLILLGLPLNMDGSEGPRAEKARQFAALLRALDVPEVLLRDERRTSVEAHAILRANGRREKRHRQSVDAVAAQLILETFLGSAENARLQRGD
ncbi:MAG TPA: Holliday junction resolvase RuvX [Candidatus Scatomorpha pullicola]|nr:Holliday junction resolvase RuvX [Candidatus Scatomorpha pullicola]